ncbi:MAG: HAMP domain-containing sensor histidine kinase [Candidatus Paceibacterota bacterium]
MDELKEENKKLKEMVDFKSDLISMMAHQLRTSLSASKWVLKMFMDGDLGNINEEQKVFVKKTYENNEKMICLVSEMIDINKENNTEIIYNKSPHDITEIVDEVIGEFMGEAKQRKVTIHFTKPSETIIECDPEKIHTAMQGLLENSIKYNKENGDVFVEIEKDEHEVTISVKDTGIGIHEEDKVHIFDKFFRSIRAKKKESVGSGLGLYAVKTIVEKHSGKIWFESKEDFGSTFFISLPIYRS